MTKRIYDSFTETYILTSKVKCSFFDTFFDTLNSDKNTVMSKNNYQTIRKEQK